MAKETNFYRLYKLANKDKETNFYRLYKLANKDKDQALKSSLFALGVVLLWDLFLP